jgi:hypothetical protein
VEEEMDVGLQMVFTKYGCEESVSDQQVWDEELLIAEIAAEADFDCLWAVEHHFRYYSFCPDNLQLPAYLTAKYPNIDVGTAAVILPWQDPIRVAKRAAVLGYLFRRTNAAWHGARSGAVRVRWLPHDHDRIPRAL